MYSAKKTELEKWIDYFFDFPPNPYVFGLLYFDPNGFQIEPYEAIVNFCQKFPMVDLCLNMNTNMIQRTRMAPQTSFDKYNNVYLSTILRKLNKKHTWLRDNEAIPAKNIYKWLMVFASNWARSAPEQGHFHHIDSPKGQEIIAKYNFCKWELKNDQ